MSLVHKVKDIKVTKKSNNLYLIESEIEFDKSFIYKNLIPSEMIQSENYEKQKHFLNCAF